MARPARRATPAQASAQASDQASDQAPSEGLGVSEGLAAITRLTQLFAEETRLIAAGKFAEGLALAAEKAAAAEGISALLASLPKGAGNEAALETLRFRVEVMQETIAANLAVLASARTVAETLLRDVARRLGPPAPDAYGPARAPRTAGRPLILSRAT